MPQPETYQLAAEFRVTKLWENLYDDEILAVRATDGEFLGSVCLSA